MNFLQQQVPVDPEGWLVVGWSMALWLSHRPSGVKVLSSNQAVEYDVRKGDFLPIKPHHL